ADMPRVERRDEPLDRPALARGVLSLEDHANRRAELAAAEQPSQGEPELGQAPPAALQPRGLLLVRELLRQVEVVEDAHEPSEPCRCPAVVRGDRKLEEADRGHDQRDTEGDKPVVPRAVAVPADHEADGQQHGVRAERVGQGDGEHEAVSIIPEMPGSEPQSVAQVREGLGEGGYVADEAAALVSFLAQRLGKPVLVEGPAGVGKTELAKALSRSTGRRLVRLQCYEGLDEAKALYEWNYRKRLLRIQAESTGEAEA